MGFEVKIDSRGRIRLPRELREGFCEVAILKRCPEGLLIQPAEPSGFLEHFRNVVKSDPVRTGVPENWAPKRMKVIKPA